jgi:hypothetical protein
MPSAVNLEIIQELRKALKQVTVESNANFVLQRLNRGGELY